MDDWQAISLSRNELLRSARNIAEITETVTEILLELGFAERSDVAVDNFDEYSDDELATYLAYTTGTVRDLVKDVNDKVTPKLSTPMAKLALKSITKLVASV